MVVQALFDSVCRCFGTVGGPSSQAGIPLTGTSTSSQHHEHMTQAERDTEIRRRTSRLELQDKEWDALFSETQKVRSSKAGTAAVAAAAAAVSSKTKPTPLPSNEVDLEYAQALAKAKLEANGESSSRHHAPHKQGQQATNPSSGTFSRRGAKRKTPTDKRDDIFRSRPQESSPVNQNQGSCNSFSRFFSEHKGVANALCFATPVRDVDEANELVADDQSDAHTLNTCEDETVTSTLYFDRKISHMVEKRPPMPLFHQFKVDAKDNDELRRIVATDSHSSLNMVRLLQTIQSQPHQEESSSSEEEDNCSAAPPAAQKAIEKALSPQAPPNEAAVLANIQDADEDSVPEPMKINSSCSSKSTEPSTSSNDEPLSRRRRSSQNDT